MPSQGGPGPCDCHVGQAGGAERAEGGAEGEGEEHTTFLMELLKIAGAKQIRPIKNMVRSVT